VIAKIDLIINKLLDQLADVHVAETQRIAETQVEIAVIAGTVKLLIEARTILVNGS